MAPVIDNVEVVLLSIPRKRGMAPAENLLVRIHAGDGASGIGACQYESRYGETAAEAALVIQKHYTPLLLKENPLNIETIMAKLDSFMPDHLASKAAIDIALHDLKGKDAKCAGLRITRRTRARKSSVASAAGEPR